MNFAKLYELQRQLDERIITERNLQGDDLLENTVLALQVELGECANEWRGFKHWSNDQEPRKEKMLEEYIDCLHFYLSLARQLGLNGKKFTYPNYNEIHTLAKLFKDSMSIIGKIEDDDCADENICLFFESWQRFCRIGRKLGYTFETLEAAYLTKNAINHERQANGY